MSRNLSLAMPEMYECSFCHKELPRSAFHEAHAVDRQRPVTSRCKKCRSDSYYNNRYETKCGSCQHNARLDKNGCCQKCNTAMGLKQCRQCDELLPLYLMFYGRSAICKKCKRINEAPSSQEPATP